MNYSVTAGRSRPARGPRGMRAEMALGCQGGGCPLTQRLAHKGDHEPLAQGAPPKLSRSIVASSAQCRSSIATAVKAADRESSPRNGANSRSRGAPGGTTRSAHRQPAARYRTTGPAGAGSAAHRTHPTTSGLPCCAAETPPAARSCQSPIPPTPAPGGHRQRASAAYSASVPRNDARSSRSIPSPRLPGRIVTSPGEARQPRHTGLSARDRY